MLRRSGIARNTHPGELGRAGGRVGGKARAARLSPARRREIARDAALARWQTPGRARKSALPRESLTRERILAAARRESVRRGVDNSRLDRIAAAAGVNRRMIYYYFGSKEGLFRELLGRSLTLLADLALHEESDDLAYWQNVFVARPDWVRLSMWEVLRAAGRPYAAAKERREFWRSAVEALEDGQRRGEFSAVSDSAQLQLTLIALAMFPFLQPQLAEFVTGFDPTTPEFLGRRALHLRELTALLR